MNETDREMLMEDCDAMEDAMSAIERSAGADLWQNRLIWRMCKAINDLLKVVGKLNKVDEHVKELGREEAEWIRRPGVVGWILSEYQCSQCKGSWVGAMNPPRYCGHCGARMKKGVNE